MSRKTKYFYVRVRLPWGTETIYQLSHDLQYALEQEMYQGHNYRQPLYHAILNVPVFEWSIQHHYHCFTIPSIVEATFIKNTRCDYRTRGQFIGHDFINPTDPNQVHYLQHDYNKLNKIIIKDNYYYLTHYMQQKGWI